MKFGAWDLGFVNHIGRRHSYKKKIVEKRYRVNEQIRVPQVQLVDPEDGMVGVVETNVALTMARNKGLDLIEVYPKANPPVAKILDFGKFKYELEKKKQKQKQRNKKIEIKGLRLTLNMAQHDLETRYNQAQKFIEQGHKIQIETLLKGREMAHTDRAFQQINNFIKNFEETVTIIQPPMRKNKKITVILQAKK